MAQRDGIVNRGISCSNREEAVAALRTLAKKTLYGALRRSTKHKSEAELKYRTQSPHTRHQAEENVAHSRRLAEAPGPVVRPQRRA